MKRPTHRVNRPVRAESKVRASTGKPPSIDALTFRMRRQAAAEAEKRAAAVAARRAQIKMV